jgi:hypothetical protein
VGINELVSLAFLASFGSGDYRTAGLVAFFMILGEVLESRTAAGARAASNPSCASHPPVPDACRTTAPKPRLLPVNSDLMTASASVPVTTSRPMASS